MDEFAGLVWRAGRAVLAQDENFGVRDCFADRIGSRIDFRWRQISRTKGFGQAVHQEGFCFRQARAQSVQRLAWHAAAGVGEVAQMFGDVSRPFELGELDVERRHGGEAGDTFALKRLQDVARHQVVEQDDAGADMESGRQLAEASVEGQRQRSEKCVVGMVLEIARNALGASDHVAMREDNAFRLTSAARGVKDRCHVGIDDAVAGAGGRAEKVIPVLRLDRFDCRGLFLFANEHDMAQVMTISKYRCQ